MGTFLVGFFATETVTSVSINRKVNGVFYGGGGTLLGYQVASICFTVGWCTIVTYILMKGIDYTIGIRVGAEEEIQGLDSSLHGESMHAEDSLHGGMMEGSVTSTGEIIKKDEIRSTEKKYSAPADKNNQKSPEFCTDP